MADRPEWDDFFSELAVFWSQMSTCSRRKVGAVVVKDKQVLGQGFNGVVSGKKHCIDGGCPRGQHYKQNESIVMSSVGIEDGWEVEIEFCACGNEWPCLDAATPGDDYTKFPCNALHAEYNAIRRAGDACKGATIYVNAQPCYLCSAQIEDAGIERIVIV